MSARQIKRLMALNQSSPLGLEVNEDESSQEEEVVEETRKISTFAGFMSDSSDEESEIENKEEIVEEPEKPKEIPSPQPSTSSGRNKSKSQKNSKNSKKKKANNNKKNKHKKDLELERELEELAKENMKESIQSNVEIASELLENSIKLKDVLKLNKRYMNDTKELKARFGEVAVNQIEEENAQLRRFTQARSIARRHNYYLITPSINNRTPPSFINGGLEMEQISSPHPYETMFFPRDYERDALYYHLHYSPEYNRINELYNSIALSMDYNDIIQFFAANPCHLESALAACELFLTTGQVDEATRILRQALFIYENAWTLTFDVDSGKIRMLNNQKENRSVYRSLFLYMFLSARKGCYSTALEISKFIYTQDPQLDHQGAILLMDYYAICANKASFIVDICKSEPSIYLGHIPLLHLPNWSYSYALALFREGHEEEARSQLIDAFLYFPQVYLKMKEKFKTINDKLLPSDILDGLPFSIPCSNETIEKLINIYVNRQFILWQDNKFIDFLTSTAYSLMNSYDYHAYEIHQEDLEREYSCQLTSNKELAQYGYSHFFGCNPSYFTDDLPHIDLNDIMNENINNRPHIPTNLPLDHNVIQLFIESLLPWLNANEENDIDNHHDIN